jgi:hypothetical protein
MSRLAMILARAAERERARGSGAPARTSGDFEENFAEDGGYYERAERLDDTLIDALARAPLHSRELEAAMSIMAHRAALPDALEASWIPELPIDMDELLDLQSRMPEPDFVPDTVTDPGMREHLRKQIRARQERDIERRRRAAQWGGSSFVQPGGQGTLLQWNSADEAPEAVNLQLGYILSGNIGTGPGFVAAASDDVSIYARVEWGGGNSNNVAYCDIQSGTQIRLTASYIRASAWYLPTSLPYPWPTQPCLPGASGPPATVTALLGRGGPQLNVSAARFTRKFAIPAAGVIKLDPIPPYASAFGIAFSPSAGQDLEIALTTNAAAVDPFTDPTRVSFTFTGTEPTTDFLFPIPQGYRFFSIENAGAAAVLVTVIYSLTLG